MLEKIFRKIFSILSILYFNLVVKKRKTKDYIPSAGKVLYSDDLKNLIDASLDMWLTSGRFNDEFEKKFAKYLDVKFAHTTASGSCANLLAISALTSYKLKERALNKGDEIITTAAGFPTTINAIIQNGLVPVFVDTEIGQYNAIVSEIEKAITPKTKAIILAHTLGNMFDINQIQSLCKKHNLWLIEDSCDALGAEFNNQKAGTIGDIGTFSFYPAHHITMGEGGCVVTNNPTLSKIIKSFRDWGRDCWCKTGIDDTCKNRFKMQFGKMPFGYDHKYIYSHIGYNLKITDWQAAIGCSQLDKIENFLEKRTKNAEFLTQQLSDLKEYLILPKTAANTKSAWFGFLITLKENCNFKKQELVEYLEQEKIATRQLFAGNVLRQPYFTNNSIKLKIKNGDIKFSNQLNDSDYSELPNTDYIMNNTFWVGIYPALGEKEILKISNAIHKFILEHK